MNGIFETLDRTNRVLFSVELRPLQGERFQPTGFPNLGAATYQTQHGPRLLVESVQSMANRLEATCWDSTANAPVPELAGISHVTVTRGGHFLTDTMLEAHRLNSPYLLENKQDRSFFDKMKEDLGSLEEGSIDRRRLGEVLLCYDIGSLLHGVFLAKKELAGGRLRVARALSAFIEASNARVAASGGVKNDHVNPSGVAKDGFGNVPFARDEFTADRLDCHINLDLAQIRGYGLGTGAESLLILLALHRVRKLLDGDLRLRTACDLEPVSLEAIRATRPEGFVLPSLAELTQALPSFIRKCADKMNHTTVKFEGAIVKAKQVTDEAAGDAHQAEPEDGESGS